MSAFAGHPETDEAFREQVCAWFRANGVDPGRVPMRAHARLTNDGKLAFRRVVYSELTDTPILDQNEPNTVLTEAATVPVVAPPSPDIARWLDGHRACTECFR